MNTPRSYSYQTRWTTVLLTLVFFGAAGCVIAHKAQGNDRGLILNGILEFGIEGATRFYWTLAALSWGFCVLAVTLALRRLLVRSELQLTEDALLMPAGIFSGGSRRIPYDTIVGISEMAVSRQRFLYVQTTTKRHSIAAAMLPDTASFEDLHAELSRLTRG